MYIRDFLPQLAELRQELAARGIQDEEFDSVYEHGTNPFVKEDVALKLSEMANRVLTPWWQFRR